LREDKLKHRFGRGRLCARRGLWSKKHPQWPNCQGDHRDKSCALQHHLSQKKTPRSARGRDQAMIISFERPAACGYPEMAKRLS